MRRSAIILSILCGVLLTGCNAANASGKITPAETTVQTAITTTAATTVQTAEPTPIWKKVEILNDGWQTADSPEALSELFAEFVDYYTAMRCQELKITFRMRGYIEVTKPFEEAFASVENKKIDAWNDTHDPFVYTAVTLRYEDVVPETIWSLAQDEDVLYVLIESCDPPMVDDNG